MCNNRLHIGVTEAPQRSGVLNLTNNILLFGQAQHSRKVWVEVSSQSLLKLDHVSDETSFILLNRNYLDLLGLE